jgi:hypothetical protein
MAVDAVGAVCEPSGNDRSDVPAFYEQRIQPIKRKTYQVVL